jgi:hypothetical protein
MLVVQQQFHPHKETMGGMGFGIVMVTLVEVVVERGLLVQMGQIFKLEPEVLVLLLQSPVLLFIMLVAVVLVDIRLLVLMLVLAVMVEEVLVRKQQQRMERLEQLIQAVVEVAEPEVVEMVLLVVQVLL